MAPENTQPTTELIGLKEYIKAKKIAVRLCKFRAPGERTEAIFRNCQLWFSEVKEFNDPFDCQIRLDTNASQEEIESFFLRLSPPEKAKFLASEAIRLPHKFHQAINSGNRKHVDSQGICCFADNYRSILMWSHYTDSHKGLCLIFNAHKDQNAFLFPLAVDYQEKYPTYNPFTSGGGNFGLIKNTVLTKSKEWEYEQEYRLFKDKPGLYNFNKEALEGVIFGANASAEFIDNIRKIAADSGLAHLQYVKAIISKTEYKLEFYDI